MTIEKTGMCETCWADAYSRSLSDTSKTQTDHYNDLLEERKDNPCKPNEQPKSAEEIFPYYDNPTDDLGIREWNQRMYDKREAYKLGKSSAQQRIKELEASKENLIKIADKLQQAGAEVNRLYFGGQQRIKELEDELKTIKGAFYDRVEIITRQLKEKEEKDQRIKEQTDDYHKLESILARANSKQIDLQEKVKELEEQVNQRHDQVVNVVCKYLANVGLSHPENVKLMLDDLENLKKR